MYFALYSINQSSIFLDVAPNRIFKPKKGKFQDFVQSLIFAKLATRPTNLAWRFSVKSRSILCNCLIVNDYD